MKNVSISVANLGTIVSDYKLSLQIEKSGEIKYLLFDIKNNHNYNINDQVEFMFIDKQSVEVIL